jgi:Carboxypeptidase regulatory-like domain
VHSKPSVHRLVTLSLVLLSGPVSPARAQQFTGTIQGIVQDATNASVPGADVSVINVGTNDIRHVTTARDGAYVLPQLKPGTYRVVVALAGFKTATVDEIKLDVQQTRAVDVRLDVGGTSETMTVAATLAPVATVSSTISQTIENKRVVDLPLNGRNPFSLATLSPGVIPAPGSSPFISGGRNATSEVTIDGISNVNAENNVSILDLTPPTSSTSARASASRTA